MKEIKVRSNNGKCMIRFEVAGRKYSITRGSYTIEADRHAMSITAAQVRLDVISGNFDESLLKYKPWEKEKLINQENARLKLLQPSLGSYEAFMEWKKGKLGYSSWKGYRALYQRLKRGIIGNPFPCDAESLEQWLKGLPVAPKTRKNYQTYFSAYGDWLHMHGLEKNPYKGVKIKVNEKPQPKPFGKYEIKLILQWFEEKAPHYLQFVRFKFATGVRTGEAVGLRWSDLDLHQSKITIAESITQGEDGSLERKSTKTGKVRELPINTSLAELFMKQMQLLEKMGLYSENGLCFPNQWGKPINSSNFAEDYWVPCLKSIKTGYRPPYNTRHSFISHALAQGANPMEIAKLTGHDPRTLFSHYANVIKKPELPEII